MQMLQWLLKGPTTEALFCQGKGRKTGPLVSVPPTGTQQQSLWPFIWTDEEGGGSGKGFLLLMKMAEESSM